MTRRELIWLAVAGLHAGRGFGLPLTGGSAEEPENLSYPLRGISDTLTPSDLFFVREHFPAPAISLENWKIRIEGRVDRSYDLNFSDLVELPTTKLETVIECAGNAANGSAVSNGIWEGVPISVVLSYARPSADAAFLMLEGADSGQLFEGKPHLPYAQVVPLDKAMDGSSLVAFKFNDQLLPKRHGFPARGLFPGWYGMDSVKWLQRIVALSAQDQPSTFLQSGMNSVYNRATEIHKDLQVARVSTVQVKSCVAWPTGRLTLPAGQHVIWGFAWSGAGLIRNVKVTKDGGKTWNPAKLERQTEAYSWVRWSYSWNASPGQYTLMSRAFDERGNQQPLERDPARKDAYELNWCVPIHCTIK